MKPYKKWIFFGKIVYPTLEQAKDKVGNFGLELGFKSWERDIRGILNVAVKLDTDSIYLTTEEFNNICDDY